MFYSSQNFFLFNVAESTNINLYQQNTWIKNQLFKVTIPGYHFLQCSISMIKIALPGSYWSNEVLLVMTVKNVDVLLSPQKSMVYLWNSAPLRSSSSTTCVCPALEARWRDVRPFSSQSFSILESMRFSSSLWHVFKRPYLTDIGEKKVWEHVK